MLLAFEPNATIIFEVISEIRDDHDEKISYRGRLRIANASPTPVMFKVKTNNAARYQVKPHLGYLTAGEARTITFIVSDSSTNADTKSVLDDFLDEYMQQIKELGKSRSAFQIMSAKLPEEAEAELPALSNDPSLSSFINSKWKAIEKNPQLYESKKFNLLLVEDKEEYDVTMSGVAPPMGPSSEYTLSHSVAAGLTSANARASQQYEGGGSGGHLSEDQNPQDDEGQSVVGLRLSPGTTIEQKEDPMPSISGSSHGVDSPRDPSPEGGASGLHQTTFAHEGGSVSSAAAASLQAKGAEGGSSGAHYSVDATVRQQGVSREDVAHDDAGRMPSSTANELGQRSSSRAAHAANNEEREDEAGYTGTGARHSDNYYEGKTGGSSSYSSAGGMNRGIAGSNARVLPESPEDPAFSSTTILKNSSAAAPASSFPVPPPPSLVNFNYEDILALRTRVEQLTQDQVTASGQRDMYLKQTNKLEQALQQRDLELEALRGSGMKDEADKNPQALRRRRGAGGNASSLTSSSSALPEGEDDDEDFQTSAGSFHLWHVIFAFIVGILLGRLAAQFM